MGLRLPHLVATLGLLLCSAASAAPKFEIVIDNRAGLPQAQIDTILEDCRTWAARVYEYHGLANPAPLTVKLSRDARIGFYRQGTIILPFNEDPWMMRDDFVHELGHHATGHDSSFFFKEGIAVHTLEKVFGDAGRVPRPWPQFGQPTDAWVALYKERGKLLPLEVALEWPHYMGGTPMEDFRSWQVYNQAGSFIGWYIRRFGFAAFSKAFGERKLDGDIAELEKRWLADIAASKPAAFDLDQALGPKPRHRGYAQRLATSPSPSPGGN